VTLLVDGPEEEEVGAAAGVLADRARTLAGERDITVLGPAPQALSRLRGRYRWHVLLKGAAGAPLREIAAALLAESERPGHGKTRVIADVDPIDVL